MSTAGIWHLLHVVSIWSNCSFACPFTFARGHNWCGSRRINRRSNGLMAQEVAHGCLHESSGISTNESSNGIQIYNLSKVGTIILCYSESWLVIEDNVTSEPASDYQTIYLTAKH